MVTYGGDEVLVLRDEGIASGPCGRHRDVVVGIALGRERDEPVALDHGGPRSPCTWIRARKRGRPPSSRRSWVSSTTGSSSTMATSRTHAPSSSSEAPSMSER